MAASIAGSLALPVPGGLPATLGKAMAKGAAVGAAGGAIAGAGAGETPLERFQGAASGATLGGLFGGGAAGVVKGGATALGRVNPAVARREGQALLGQAVARENKTPADLAMAIQKANAAGVKGMTVGDVAQPAGPVRALAEASLKGPNPLGGRYAAFLAERQEGVTDRLGVVKGGQLDRITTAVKDKVGVANARTFQTARDLAQTRAQSASKLFDQARQFQPMSNPQVKDVWADTVATDYGKEGLAVAQRLWTAQRPGQAMPATPTMEVMQTLKEGLDDVVGSLWRAGKGAEAKAAEGVRDRFRDTLKAANPVYGEALKRYAGDSAMIEALEKGKKFLSTPADEVEFALTKMTEGEAEQFRVGAVTALVDKLRQKAPGPTTDFTGELRKQDVWRRIAAIMPDEQSLEELATIASAERGQSSLATRLGGSRTGELAETAKAIEGGENSLRGLRGPSQMGGITLADLTLWLHDKITGKLSQAMTQQRRAAITELLMEQDARAAEMLQSRLGGAAPVMPGAPTAQRAGVAGGYLGGIAGAGMMGGDR
jgi:hypothetical protein